jgi:hypothetical protein
MKGSETRGLKIRLQTLPEQFTAARERRGESTRQAAIGMNVDYGHLLKFERGGTDPKLSTVLAVLDYIEET